MLVRLILSLLLAAFTLPAMASAPCHDTPAPMAMAAGHSMPAMPVHQDKAIALHDCMGCIPPSSLKSGADLGAPLQPAEIRIAGFARLNPGKAPAPATPPPRTEA
jgi:hypothetical protein